MTKKLLFEERFKSAIKLMHWKIAPKQQEQLLFLSRKGRIFISRKAFP